MFQLALECGISPEQFGFLTPKEISFVIKAEQKRRQQEYNLTVMNAWLGAVLERQKKIKPLDKLIGEVTPKTKQRQTPEQMLAIAQLFAASHNKNKKNK